MRYDDPVKRWIVLALACYMMGTVSCHSAERSSTCAPISSATRVQIQSSPGNSNYVITDPVRVRDLIAFANARRDVSQAHLYTEPAPQTTAIFYDGNNFIAAFGVGSNFFFVSCSNLKGTRQASAVEISRFETLVASGGLKAGPK